MGEFESQILNFRPQKFPRDKLIVRSLLFPVPFRSWSEIQFFTLSFLCELIFMERGGVRAAL